MLVFTSWFCLARFLLWQWSNGLQLQLRLRTLKTLLSSLLFSYLASNSALTIYLCNLWVLCECDTFTFAFTQLNHIYTKMSKNNEGAKYKGQITLVLLFWSIAFAFTLHASDNSMSQQFRFLVFKSLKRESRRWKDRVKLKRKMENKEGIMGI